jgi:hypothetical protein
MIRIARTTLLIVQAFVAITALAGGLALVVGSIDPAMGSVLMPPAEYLAGSPFRTYLVPGLLLIVLVAGLHAVAFFAVLWDARWRTVLSAAGGFSCLIWIFVQMVYIPFSFLQALYFVIGLVELGLTMVVLGIVDDVVALHRSTFVPIRSGRTPHAHG